MDKVAEYPVQESYKQVRYMMGSFVLIEAKGKCAHEAVSAAFDEMERVEKMLSRFTSESVVSHLNQHAAQFPVHVSTEFFSLIKKCLEYSKKTGGAFDLTLKPVTDLWSCSQKTQQVPSVANIKRARDKTGFYFVHLNDAEKTVFFDHDELEIDFGAVGKGYAVDLAAQVLKSFEVDHAVINTTSSIYAMGDETTWGIRHPREESEIVESMILKDSSLSTSAQYERYYEVGGKRYGHIMNPKSGEPAKSDLLSVSIVSDSAFESEVLSTAFFVIGFNARTYDLLESFKVPEALFIRKGLLGNFRTKRFKTTA